MDTREELQEKLAFIRKDYPTIAKEIWDLFKTIKTPEKITERVIITDENKQGELEQEILQLHDRLQHKEFHLKQKDAEIQRLGECLKALDKIWEDRTTVYVDDIHINHPYLTHKFKDKELNSMFSDQVWQLAENLSHTVHGIDKLSYAEKKMLLHIGFSEFHFFKTLAAADGKDAGNSMFGFHIKKR